MKLPRWLFEKPEPSPSPPPPTFADRLNSMLASGYRPVVKTHDVLENNQWPRIWWKVDAYPLDKEVRKMGYIVGSVHLELEDAMRDTERRVAALTR